MTGLTRVRNGRLLIDGETWQEGRRFVPVHRRAVGYVFQEASLFPHLSVRGNLEFGWKRAKRGQRTIDFDDLVDLLAIAPLFDRPTAHLSGGERQRTAIARAMAHHPRLVLADEPTGNLDPVNREKVLDILFDYVHESGTTLVSVTHDHEILERFAEVVDFRSFHAFGPSS